ncbi:choice-of-anchor G family protein [Jonesia quinghaiensis]|uniref:choice-of-anchor G family protein n=1 Tax=Jonesia quinghaiensis TaxID=262806 RepID=UPI0003F7C3E9|nr:choice-of-anchor G family protein [Jonesia quinghaiensis]
MTVHPPSTTQGQRQSRFSPRFAFFAAGFTTTCVALIATPVLSVAAWVTPEHVHGTVGTSSYQCESEETYSTTATAKFIEATVLSGTPLASLADVEGVTTEFTEEGSFFVSPSGSTDLHPTPPRRTFANPLSVQVVEGLVALDLSQLLNIPVDGAAVGGLNQWSSVDPRGVASAAAGLVSDSGGVLVSDAPPPDSLPSSASLSLTDTLPTLSGIAGIDDVSLEIGAVSASSSIDWCEMLRSRIWGGDNSLLVERDYRIAGLGLNVDSTLVASLGSAVTQDVVPAVEAEMSNLVGVDGLVSQVIVNEIAGVLASGLGIGDVSGTVSLTQLDLASAVSELTDDRLSDGVVTIDLSSGLLTADLEALLGYDQTSLNNLAPNTELLINSTVINALSSRVSALLDQWVEDVESTVLAALRNARLTIDLNVMVRILGGIDIVDVNVTADQTIGNIMDGDLEVAVTLTNQKDTAVLNTALSLLGLSLNDVLSSLSGLTNSLVGPVVNTVSSTVNSALAEVASTLNPLVSGAVTSLDSVWSALAAPGVLSIMANVQPDSPGGPQDFTYAIDEGNVSSGEFVQAALRVGVGDQLIPDSVAVVYLAVARVGPVVDVRG